MQKWHNRRSFNGLCKRDCSLCRVWTKIVGHSHACILTSLFVFWITSHIVCCVTLFCTGTKWCILGNGKEDQVLLHVGLSWKAVQQCTYVLSVKQPQVRHHLLTHVLHVTVTSLCAPPWPALMISTNNLTRRYSTHTHLHTTRDEWNSWCYQSTVHPGPKRKMFGCYLEVPCKCRGLLCTRLFLKAPQYTNVHILIFPPRSYWSSLIQLLIKETL